MARIQLRDTNIYIRDGLSGSFLVNQSGSAPAEDDTTLTIDAVSTNYTADGDDDVVPIGARFENDGVEHTVTARTPSSGGPTTDITFTPGLSSSPPADDEEITVLPQRIEIKIGDGDANWTETVNYEYDLDRDQLDTVRQGEDAPLEVDLNFTFEYVTTESGQAITPIDALKRKGEASDWVSSSDDKCEPYAVDVYIVHCVPCGTDQDEDYLFPDFRYESLEFSLQDAAISVSGRANVTEATVSRGDHC